MLLVEGLYAVALDECVAVAPRVEPFDEQVLVLLILFGQELLRAEPVAEALFVGLLHGALELAFVLGIDACEEDFVDLDFLVLVDDDVYQHAVVARHVFALHDVDLAVLESLFLKVLLDVVFGAVHQVGCDLVAGLQSDELFAVFALALLHALVVDAGDAGLCGELDVEVNLARHDTVGHNLHVGEELLVPVAAHGIADVGTGHFVGFAHVEARDVLEQVFVVVFHPAHGEASQHVARVAGRVGDMGGVVGGGAVGLGLGR